MKKVLIATGALLLAALILAVLDGMRSAKMASCANHIHMLSLELVRHVRTSGWLPHREGGAADEVLRGIPHSYPAGLNCNEAAPEQGVGGWQYLHASPEAWAEFLKEFPGESMPVVWCGRAHSFVFPWRENTRMCLRVHVSEDLRNIYGLRLDRRGNAKLGRERFRLEPGDLSDGELRTWLERVNRILRRRGEPEIAPDILP